MKNKDFESITNILENKNPNNKTLETASQE
jgi:hypothetical protein